MLAFQVAFRLGLADGGMAMARAAACACIQQQRHALGCTLPLGSAASSQAVCSPHAYATTSSSGRTKYRQLPPGGPSREKLRLLPFRVKPSEAEAAFHAYHGTGMLQSRQSPAIRTRQEAYLPFWVGSAAVVTRIRSAEVGFETLAQVYNPATRRYESRWQTNWQRVSLEGVGWAADFSSELPDMQLYASWKYPAGDISKLRPGPLVVTAGPLTPAAMDASDGGVRRVGPFQMPPEAARKLLKSAVESAERQRAEDTVRSLTKAQQVRFIDMTTEYVTGSGSGPTLAPMYVPAHIFSWVHAGIKVRTFVSGVDAAAVAGTRTLDETKVATLAAVTSAGFMLLLGAPLFSNAFLYSGLLVPLVLGGMAARYWPVVRAYMQAGTSAASAAWYARNAEGASWDEEYVRPDGDRTWRRAGEQQQQRQQQQWGQRGRQQEQRRQQQWQQQWGQGPGGGSAAPGGGRDPQGFYRELGVSPGASQAEVQAAFRGLALKHHPDRYTAEADKKAATTRFQRITAAYQVLRDPGRRRAYDAGLGG